MIINKYVSVVAKLYTQAQTGEHASFFPTQILQCMKVGTLIQNILLNHTGNW